MNKQLAQLPTTGNYAADAGATLGTLCGRHVRFAVPAGAVTENQKIAAIEKMVDGMKTGKMKVETIRIQIKRELGVTPVNGNPFTPGQVEEFFIPIPQTPL